MVLVLLSNLQQVLFLYYFGVECFGGNIINGIMKARVKSTGVLVDVTPQLNINSQHSKDYLYVCDNMVFKECELDFSAIDWEQRRYEIAKECVAVLMRNIDTTLEDAAKVSVKQADILIKRLKEDNDE